MYKICKKLHENYNCIFLNKIIGIIIVNNSFKDENDGMRINNKNEELKEIIKKIVIIIHDKKVIEDINKKDQFSKDKIYYKLKKIN